VDANIVRVTLSLIGPVILLIFAAAFFAAWRMDRRRTYLALFGSACVLFTLGAGSQILRMPLDTGMNSLVSGALYTTAVLVAAQSLLRRGGRAVSWGSLLSILAAFLLALWYYFYVDRNLLARVYIQNFGYGLVLLGAALRLRHMAHGSAMDRVLFWVLLLFAVQFFPRTMLTLGFVAPVGERAFANSAFWQTLQLSLAVLGTALALAMLAACALDIIDGLRRERDIDGLSGMLNRRAFEERVAAALSKPGSAAALILCDVDHFKVINDTWGHHAGDEVLRTIAQLLRFSVHERAIIGRLGGEEFGVFLTDTGPLEAHAVATHLRRTIADHGFVLGGVQTQVTASFGVSEALLQEGWQGLYRRADGLLYDAKRGGRNQVVAHAVTGQGT
jgi:diguanylate cyclase (GGDEF)-like protein